MTVEAVEMGADVIFYGERDLQVVHILVHDEELLALLVGVGACPDDDLDDLVYYVTVDCKP